MIKREQSLAIIFLLCTTVCGQPDVGDHSELCPGARGHLTIVLPEQRESSMQRSTAGLALVQTTEPSPVKVFILAGQSNMQGKGAAKTLPWLGEDKAYGHLLKTIQNEDGTWRKRDDVWIDYLGRRGPLDVGFGSEGSEHGPLIGPEYGFGMVAGDHFDEPVLLIKAAWGGKDVAEDFKAPGSGGPGPFYVKTVEHAKDVLKNMGTYFPDLEGRSYEIAGIVWFQGWNDMVDEEKRQAYTANLAQMLRDLRRDLNAPNAPVVIGELGVDGDKAKGNIAEFRNAQAAVAEVPDLKGNVILTRTAPYYDQHAHQLFEDNVWQGPEKQKYYEIASDRPYHYLGSGKIYFLMGHAFGKDMLKLQTKGNDIAQ